MQQQVSSDVTMPYARRGVPRFAYREMFIVGAGEHVLRIEAYNISNTGICGEIVGKGILSEGREIEIYLHNYAPINGRVRWARGREVGLIFTEDLAHHPRIRGLVSRMENGEPAVPCAAL